MNPLYCTLAFFGSLLAVHLAMKYWPRSLRGRFLQAHAELQHDMRRRGLSPAQQAQEFTFRYHMVEYRQELSEAVLSNPAGYRQLISSIAAQTAKTIAATDPDVAKRFVKVIDEARLEDILTPEAMAAVDRFLTADVYVSPETYAKAIAAARTL